MEKLRAILEQLKKYHFWILCGLIVLLSFGSWFMATGAQESSFDKQKKEYDGKIRIVTDIAGNAQHPSQKYIDEIRAITNGPLTKQVATASNRLYNEQRKANPLPILFADKTAQEGFETAFEKIWRPMEDIEKLPPGELSQV